VNAANKTPDLTNWSQTRGRHIESRPSGYPPGVPPQARRRDLFAEGGNPAVQDIALGFQRFQLGRTKTAVICERQHSCPKHGPVRKRERRHGEERLKNRLIAFVTIYVVIAVLLGLIVWLTMGNVIFEFLFDVFREMFRYVSFHQR